MKQELIRDLGIVITSDPVRIPFEHSRHAIPSVTIEGRPAWMHKNPRSVRRMATKMLDATVVTIPMAKAGHAATVHVSYL